MEKKKKITTELYACHGYGCGFSAYESKENVEIEVSDEAAETLKAMLGEKGQLSEEDVAGTIESGKKELQAVYDALKEKHKDMVARYWLFDAYNQFIDESLEPYFWEDVKNGLYKPYRTLEEFAKDPYDDEEEVYDDYSEKDLADEKRLRYKYFCRYRDRYLKWVNGNEDYYFIADRVGVCLDNVYEDLPELEFVISKVEG